MIQVILKTLFVAFLVNVILIITFRPQVPSYFTKCKATVFWDRDEKALLIFKNNEALLIPWEYGHTYVLASVGKELNIAYYHKDYSRYDVIVLNPIISNFTFDKIFIQLFMLFMIFAYYFKKYWKQKYEDEEGFL